MLKHLNRGLGEDGKRLKQMTHEIPFKKLIWKFSPVSRWLASRKNFVGISLVSLTCETVAKLSVQSWKTWELDPLTCDWTYTWNKSRKNPENMFFHIKTIWKTLKNMGDTNHFQKQTKRTKIFLVWSTYSWAHTHHIWTCTITQMK